MVLIATAIITAAVEPAAASIRSDYAIDSDAVSQASTMDHSDSDIKCQLLEEDLVDSDVKCQILKEDHADSDAVSQASTMDRSDTDIEAQLPKEDQVDSNIDGDLCAQDFDHYKLSKAQKDGVFLHIEHLSVALQRAQFLQEAIDKYNSRVCKLGRFTSSNTKKSFMPQISFAGDALSTISKANIHRHMAEMEKVYERVKVHSPISDDYVLYPMLDQPL
ncbi:hypothetical protein GGI22_007750, partial [Coemansia erecta]